MKALFQLFYMLIKIFALHTMLVSVYTCVSRLLKVYLAPKQYTYGNRGDYTLKIGDDQAFYVNTSDESDAMFVNNFSFFFAVLY